MSKNWPAESDYVSKWVITTCAEAIESVKSDYVSKLVICTGAEAK